MTTFEEQAEIPVEQCAVIVKATVNDNWALYELCQNEADANLLAVQLVASPTNYAMAKVLKPTGNLYKDTE